MMTPEEYDATLDKHLEVLGRVVAACENEEAPNKKWADLRLVARDVASIAGHRVR